MSLEGLDDATVKQLAELSLSMAGNEKTRKQFLKLTKEVAPGTPIPELEWESSMDARLKKEREEIDGKLQKLEEAEFKRNVETQRSRVMEENQLSPEDMEKLDKMIADKELPADYKWAGRLYKQQIEPVEPTNYGSSGYGPAELPMHEGLLDNPDKWASKTAHDVIDQLQKKGHTFSQ